VNVSSGSRLPPARESARKQAFIVAGASCRTGWTDAVRALHPDEKIYTFWKYFRNAFASNAGIRIDHLLLSPALANQLVSAGVDRDVRNWEKARSRTGMG
jgi:exonuclease III